MPSQTLPIMLALCLMLLATYYAQNYAGIIGGSLTMTIYVHTYYLVNYICMYVRTYT